MVPVSFNSVVCTASSCVSRLTWSWLCKSPRKMIASPLRKHSVVYVCTHVCVCVRFKSTQAWYILSSRWASSVFLKVKLALWLWRGSGIYVTLWIRGAPTCHPPWRRRARWIEVVAAVVGEVWRKRVPQISPWSFDLSHDEFWQAAGAPVESRSLWGCQGLKERRTVTDHSLAANLLKRQRAVTDCEVAPVNSRIRFGRAEKKKIKRKKKI